MNSFALAIEYLTGYAVATDPANREQPEWPPHPGRVFMALAAAHFEADASETDKRDERAALDWLATLPPPAMAAPRETMRQTQVVYVPVNDVAGLAAMPSSRSRQPRVFPRVHVGDQVLYLIWQGDDQSGEHLSALERLCGEVTRIGHSSSLAWVRLLRDASDLSPTLAPVEGGVGGRNLRIATEGETRRLEAAANFDNDIAYRQLTQLVKENKDNKKEQRKYREQLAERFPHGQPATQWPQISLSVSYEPVASPEPSVPATPFDPNFIVLSVDAEQPQAVLGLESTLQLTAALRGAIMSHYGDQPIPAWVSGHDADGGKLQEGVHLALVPLAFTDSGHADGHVMGMGVLIPREVPHRERARALGPLLFDDASRPRTVPLTLGRAGAMYLLRETAAQPARTLRPTTWTQPSVYWRSVTPVVLDRMPKIKRQQDPVAWRSEVAAIITSSCINAGLPEPVGVRVEKTPMVRGSLRAMPGQGGFPLLRPGTFQVHVALTFAAPVQGPVVIGAGRFRGYGLCRPVQEDGVQ